MTLKQTPWWRITGHEMYTIKKDDRPEVASAVVIDFLENTTLRFLEMTKLTVWKNKYCLNLYHAYNVSTFSS